MGEGAGYKRRPNKDGWGGGLDLYWVYSVYLALTSLWRCREKLIAVALWRDPRTSGVHSGRDGDRRESWTAGRA